MVCLKTVLKNLLLKKFSRVVVVYCSVIKVLFCCSFQSTAFIFYQKLFSLSRTFLTFFKAIWLLFSNKLIYNIISFFICQELFNSFLLCCFSRISLNSLSFSLSFVKNLFVLFRHFSVVFQPMKIPFLNSVLNKRRRRDLNPRAATNDLLPFQGSPFGQLGYFSKSGEGGIRTHAPFRTNGFQDRLVMTTSIPLQDT